MEESIIRFDHVSMAFPGVLANDDISLEIRRGEVFALVGENGAGKSTLMNILYGIYEPTDGEVWIRGERMTEHSPKAAIAAGVGMVHQHFKLVPSFTVAQNIVLSREPRRAGIFFDERRATALTRELCEEYGLQVDPEAEIRDLGVGEQQRVEILKALYRGADILILDEPTAVLTPQETDRLFAVMRNMQKDGKSLIIITHKLHEVLEVSDRVAILRKGEYIGDVLTKDADQQSLTDMMVGRAVSLNIDRPMPVDPKPRLEVKGLTVYDELGVKRLNSINFTAYSGEVLGIAGVAGSGQRELLEAISGLYPIAQGSIIYHNPKTEKTEDLAGKDPLEIQKAGISMAFVPEDRLGMGLVGSMGMTGNMMLRSWRKNKGPFLDKKEPERVANEVWKELEVVTPSIDFPVRRMSGGNVQKVLVGREIAQDPAVLMTAYAVRGLDINTSYTIYNLLTAEKMKGVAVIYVGEDLDVLLELCDRLLVLCGGQVSGVVDARTTDKRQVGVLMTRVGGKTNEK